MSHPLARCPLCHNDYPEQEVRCPYCATPNQRALRELRGRRRLRPGWVLAGFSLMMTGVGLWAELFGVHSAAEVAGCSTAKVVELVPGAPHPVPGFVAALPGQVDRGSVPFVELATVEYLISNLCKELLESGRNRLPTPVQTLLAEKGGNAYLHEGAVRVARGWRMKTRVVLAMPAPLPDTVVASHWPSGRAAMISHVWPGDAADAAGLKPGDLVVRFDGQALSEPSPQRSFFAMSDATKPGQRITLQVWRADRLNEISIQRPLDAGFGYHAIDVPLAVQTAGAAR